MMTQEKLTRTQLIARLMQIETKSGIFFTEELELSLKKSQECNCNLSGYCINACTSVCPEDLSVCDTNVNYRHIRK